MGHGKDDLAVTVSVGRMDIALHNIIVHQAVNDIGTLALGSTDNRGMPEQIALINESVDTHALTLAKIFEGSDWH